MIEEAIGRSDETSMETSNAVAVRGVEATVTKMTGQTLSPRSQDRYGSLETFGTSGEIVASETAKTTEQPQLGGEISE
jgi:hypothetical protein